MVGAPPPHRGVIATFTAAAVPNMVGVATRQELQTLPGQDLRAVLITTIHQFGEADGKLNERANVIVAWGWLVSSASAMASPTSA